MNTVQRRATNMTRTLGLALAGALIAGATAEAQQGGSTPVPAAETLRGHRAMAVDVVNSSKNLSERAVRALLEEAIKDGGIEVLPAGSFPVLRVIVGNEVEIRYRRQTGTWVSTDVFEIYTIRLEFAQLVPLAGSGSPRHARASTWAQARYGYASDAAIGGELTRTAAGLIAAFIKDYRSVNGQQTARPAPRPAPADGAGSGAAPAQDPGVQVKAEVRPFHTRAPTYRFHADNPAIRAQIDAIAESGQNLLFCTYGPTRPDGTGFRIYMFWHDTAPEGIREMVVGRHPLSGLGFEGVSECPATIEAADARRLLMRNR